MIENVTRRAAPALAAFVCLVASAPGAPAADPSILGKWEIVEAAPAPWTRPENHAALAAEGKGLMHPRHHLHAQGSDLEVQAIQLQAPRRL
jgi:hypothetical protein